MLINVTPSSTISSNSYLAALLGMLRASIVPMTFEGSDIVRPIADWSCSGPSEDVINNILVVEELINKSPIFAGI